MLLTNTFEGGSGGVAITAGNSGGASGTAFDQVTVSAGDGAANFDTAHPAHGGLGMLCQTGATTGEAYVMWSAALGGTFATLFDRTYLYLPALPGTQTRLIRWLSVSTVRGSVQISTAGKLLLTDSAGTTVATSATTLPTGSQFRVEAKCTGDAAAGVLEAKIFLTPDATSPNETLTATALNTGGTIDRVRFGQTGTAIANVSFYLDDLGAADGDYLGPASAPSQYQPLSPQWFIQRGLWKPWQGTGSDVAAAVAQVTLSDSGSASDSLSVAVAAPLTDTGAASDTLAVAAAVPLADTGTAVDTLGVAIPVPLADIGSAVDSFTVSVAVPLGDTGSGADTLTVAAAIPLADTGTASDSISVQQGGQAVTLNDSGTATDSLTVAAAVPLADTGTAGDQVAVAVAIPLADVGAGSDSIVVQQIVPKPLSDTGTATDSLTVTATVPLADLGVAADSIVVSALLGLADTGAAADSFSVQIVGPGAPTPGTLTATDVLLATVAARSASATPTASDGAAGGTPTSATATLTAVVVMAGGPT